MVVGTAVGATTGDAIPLAFDQVQFKGVSARRSAPSCNARRHPMHVTCRIIVFSDHGWPAGHDVARPHQSSV